MYRIQTARSCRFALHNIRKIRPFLTEHAAQLLVQALVISRLDYCSALLAGLPSNTIKPLQMIQNAAHVTPLFISFDWLPVAACIQFKTLMLANRTITGSVLAYFHSLLRIYIPSRSPSYFHSLLRIYIPSRSPAYFHSLLRIYIPSRSPAYFHSLLRIYIPSRSLRSASEWRLVVPSQKGSKSLSRTFSFTAPGRWNNLPPPPPSGLLNPCQSSRNNWKLISFGTYTTWLHHKCKN